MNRIKTILNTIKDNDVISGFIVPGVDRKTDLSLKHNCKTMIYQKGLDPYKSRNFFISFLKKYNWFRKLVKTQSFESYKTFIVINKDGLCTWQDDKRFDAGCVFDAENMI